MLPVPANPVPENIVSDVLFLTDNTTSHLTRSVSLVRNVAARMGTILVSTELTHGPRKEKIVVSYFADHLPLLFANGVAVAENDNVVPLTVANSVEGLLFSLIRLEIVPPSSYRRVMEADADSIAQKEIEDLVRSTAFWNIINFASSLRLNERFHPLFTNMDVFVDAERTTHEIRNLRIEYWEEVRNYALSTWKLVSTAVEPQPGNGINKGAIVSVTDSLLDDVETFERMELEKREWFPVSGQFMSVPGSCFGSTSQLEEKEGENKQISVQSAPKGDNLVKNTEKEETLEITMEKRVVGFSFSANNPSTCAVVVPRSTGDFVFKESALSSSAPQRPLTSSTFGSQMTPVPNIAKDPETPSVSKIFPVRKFIFNEISGKVVAVAGATKNAVAPSAAHRGKSSCKPSTTSGKAAPNHKSVLSAVGSVTSFDLHQCGRKTSVGTEPVTPEKSSEVVPSGAAQSTLFDGTKGGPAPNLPHTVSIGSSSVVAAASPTISESILSSSSKAAPPPSVPHTISITRAATTSKSIGLSSPEKLSDVAPDTVPSVSLALATTTVAAAIAVTTSKSISSSGASSAVDLSTLAVVPTTDPAVSLPTQVIAAGTQRQHDTQIAGSSTPPSDVVKSSTDIPSDRTLTSAQKPLISAPVKLTSTTSTLAKCGQKRQAPADRPVVLPPPKRRPNTLFGVKLTANEVVHVEVKRIPNNWDRSIKEGSDTYQLLREFLNKVLAGTGNSLVVTNRLDRCQEMSFDDIYLRLTLTRLAMWPGLYIRIKGSGCQLESAVLLAFVQLLLDVTGMSHLSPYVEAVLHNEKLNAMVLNAIVVVLVSGVNMGRHSARAFDEVVYRYWQHANGQFRNELANLLNTYGNRKMKEISSQGVSRLRHVCITFGGLLGQMGLFEHTSPPVISANSIRKISAGPTDWQEGDDSDVEVVEPPPKPVPELIDLTGEDESVVDNGPELVSFPKNTPPATPPAPPSQESAYCLPFGLVQPASTLEGRVSTTITQFENRLSESESQKVNEMTRQRYNDVLRFMNELLKKTGFSLTIALEAEAKKKGRVEEADSWTISITVDQLRPLTMRRGGGDSREPVAQTELSILSNFLGQLVMPMHLSERGIWLKEVVSYPESTTLLVNFISAMLKSCRKTSIFTRRSRQPSAKRELDKAMTNYCRGHMLELSQQLRAILPNDCTVSEKWKKKNQQTNMRGGTSEAEPAAPNAHEKPQPSLNKQVEAVPMAPTRTVNEQPAVSSNPVTAPVISNADVIIQPAVNSVPRTVPIVPKTKMGVQPVVNNIGTLPTASNSVMTAIDGVIAQPAVISPVVPSIPNEEVAAKPSVNSIGTVPAASNSVTSKDDVNTQPAVTDIESAVAGTMPATSVNVIAQLSVPIPVEAIPNITNEEVDVQPAVTNVDTVNSETAASEDNVTVAQTTVNSVLEAALITPKEETNAQPVVNSIGTVPATPNANEPPEGAARSSRKRLSSPDETLVDSPATKLRKDALSFPFGLSTPFNAKKSIWHHLNQLPFTEDQQEIMLTSNSKSMPAALMRKQFMNRLLAKVELNLVLEQYTEPSSSHRGFVIRFEIIPDSLFRVEYRVDTSDSFEQVEDEMLAAMLTALSGGVPALLPPDAASAVLLNQKSADHLVTYVAGALKSVVARLKSLRGFVAAGVSLSPSQMKENLNSCLTEYWGNNQRALETRLKEARNDFGCVPLLSTKGTQQQTMGSSEQDREASSTLPKIKFPSSFYVNPGFSQRTPKTQTTRDPPHKLFESARNSLLTPSPDKGGPAGSGKVSRIPSQDTGREPVGATPSRQPKRVSIWDSGRLTVRIENE